MIIGGQAEWCFCGCINYQGEIGLLGRADMRAPGGETFGAEPNIHPQTKNNFGLHRKVKMLNNYGLIPQCFGGSRNGPVVPATVLFPFAVPSRKRFHSRRIHFVSSLCIVIHFGRHSRYHCSQRSPCPHYHQPDTRPTGPSTGLAGP